MSLIIAVLVGSLAVGLLAVAGLWVRSRFLPAPSRHYLGFRDALASLVEQRLGGYEQVFCTPDPSAAPRLNRPYRVAVIGAGLGGIGAATTLGERGAEVVIFEKNSYLGGKLGAWTATTSDGSEQEVEHGFHAFFRNYYNLNRFLKRLNLHHGFREVSDYQVLDAGGRSQSYRGVDTAPVLNLISLGAHGVFRWSEIFTTQALHEMDRFLLYDAQTTFAELDHVDFETFAPQGRASPLAHVVVQLLLPRVLFRSRSAIHR